MMASIVTDVLVQIGNGYLVINEFMFRKFFLIDVKILSADTALFLCVLRAMRSSPKSLRTCQNRDAKLPKQLKLCASATSA